MTNRLQVKEQEIRLEGKNVLLRPYLSEDLERWYQWFNDAEVVRHMDQRRGTNTKDRQADYLKRMSESATDIQLAIVCKKDNALIGTVGLHGIDRANRNADISIIIGEKDYWGQGYGAEAVALIMEHAFKGLNLHKVTAGFIDGNKGSEALFTRLGFKVEGRFKDQIFIEGQFKDIIKMALLHDHKGRK